MFFFSFSNLFCVKIEQQKLVLHNKQIVSEARMLNIDVVDTFNKTVAMFQDFYPGKCACHFHQVRMKTNFLWKLKN